MVLPFSVFLTSFAIFYFSFVSCRELDNNPIDEILDYAFKGLDELQNL